jgi:hypothetical protein
MSAVCINNNQAQHQANMSLASATLETPIPTGSWTLYYHPNNETKWTLSSFVRIATVKTWGDFWTLMNGLGVDNLHRAQFFWMRDPIPPLWENKDNIRGGNYSARVSDIDVGEVFIRYAIAMMLGELAYDTNNVMNGISIAPKKGFAIVKFWNNRADMFSNVNDIHKLHPSINTSDVLYTPFTQKKFY